MLTYSLFWLGARLAPLLPEALGQRGAALAGLLAYLLAGRARAAVRANLLHVLGHPPPPALVRAVFRHGAQNYYDLFRLPALGRDRLQALVEVCGWEHLAAARAAGRGVLLVTAHFGSVELVGQLVALSGCPANVVVEPVRPAALLALLRRLRESYGIRTLPVGPGLLQAISAALSRNEVVGLLSDRDVLGNGVWVPFFGTPARLPAGAAALSLRTGAAVLPAFTLRLPGGRYRGWFEPPLTPVRTGAVHTDILVNTERITRVIEAAIRRHPEQWTVFQPVWPADQVERAAARQQ